MLNFIVQMVTRFSNGVIFMSKKEEDSDRITCGNALISGR